MSSPPQLIYLIGYRGTGKSTVARLLTEKLGWHFLDMDSEIEARNGKSIRQIFADEGEPAFRRIESELLHEVSSLTQHVIATGGGVILDPNNRACLKNSGQVIWLTGKPATLWNRILEDATSKDRRPDLTVGGLGEIEQLLKVREPLYCECANLEIAVDDRTPDQIADIVAQLASALLKP
jgi:shikimate kinase